MASLQTLILPCLTPSPSPSLPCLHPSPSLRFLSSSLPHSHHLSSRPPPVSSRYCSSLLRSLALASSSASGDVIEAPADAPSGLVSAVLFDMDGVLCDSEERSRLAGVDLFAEMGVKVSQSDFFPFMGTGEANFLGGVARASGLKDFDPAAAKSRFFQIYLEKYATPNSGLGFPGALELVLQCKNAGLKTALASSADRLKIDANLAAAGLPHSHFDVIISADAFENLKPAPDIFLAAAKALNVPASECVVIEDAVAGLQAARAAEMRCIAVATTLSDEILMQESPALIKKDIGHISLNDILKPQASDCNQIASSQVNSKLDAGAKDVSQYLSSIKMELDKEVPLPAGLVTTRRDILKFGSLLGALSSSYIVLSHWKAMSYASPKAILNALMGLVQPPIASDTELNDSVRVTKFKSYINDLETRGGGQQVPEFQARQEWLNTVPLRLRKDLVGKVVILDFWTYCCINCMHILPDLEYLEKKYKEQPLTVVGVHSAKFDNEKDLSAIRNAVLRYNVTHPVVNDGEMVMWRQLGVNSWPTLVVVSPQGKLLAMLSGEGHRKDLDDILNAALEYYGEKKLLDNRPIPQVLEKDKDTRLVSSPLQFPGKLTTDLANRRLFISDSNHHRIIVTDFDGNFIQQIGGLGGDGLQDGSFDDAAFSRPQGVAYNSSKNVLYVADTENHALREIDFVNEMVRTLAGNGVKGSDYKGGKRGILQVLNSPWDVCCNPALGVVYIAMAGQHQIWQHNLADAVTKVFSGDGYERNLNGKRGQETSYAQPSGVSLSADMKEICVADSESSSIRTCNLVTGGSKLLAGGDPMFPDNLFQFGDKDGSGTSAQFQHPLGVLYGTDGLVYIADSYNHKIKTLDLNSKKVKTVVGTGKAGFKDGIGLASQLSEPSGLAEGLNGKFYISDTNNSVIRVLDTKRDGSPLLSTLELKGLPHERKMEKPRRLQRRPSSDTEIIKVSPIKSANGNFQIEVSLPTGFHFTKEVASKFETDVEPADKVMLDPLAGALSANGQAVIHFNHQMNESATVQINCKIYYCEEEEVCLYKSLAFQIPFDPVLSDATNVVPLVYNVKPPVIKGLSNQS